MSDFWIISFQSLELSLRKLMEFLDYIFCWNWTCLSVHSLVFDTFFMLHNSIVTIANKYFIENKDQQNERKFSKFGSNYFLLFSKQQDLTPERTTRAQYKTVSFIFIHFNWSAMKQIFNQNIPKIKLTDNSKRTSKNIPIFASSNKSSTIMF